LEITENQKNAFEKMLVTINQPKIKAVSFGISETLVIMPFLYSTDLFFLMESEFSKLSGNKKSFSQLRTQAEKNARKNDEFSEPDIKAIYSELKTISGISDEDSEKLMNLEENLILKFCRPRKCGTELLREAQRLNKKIILVDDTYLTENIIEKILKKCGITGWKMIFLSNKTGLNKSGGDIYPHILKRLKLNSGHMFHIGSNLQADVESPINQGIMSLYLPSCREQLFKNGRLCGYIYTKAGKKINTEKYFSLRCLMGIYALYAFDYPLSNLNKENFCGNRKNIGFTVLGGIFMNKNYSPENKYEDIIISALKQNSEVVSGENDFKEIYLQCFGNSLDMLEKNGCELPLKLLVSYAGDTEKNLLKDIMPEEDYQNWYRTLTEFDICANISGKNNVKNKKSFFSKIKARKK